MLKDGYLRKMRQSVTPSILSDFLSSPFPQLQKHIIFNYSSSKVPAGCAFAMFPLLFSCLLFQLVLMAQASARSIVLVLGKLSIVI